MGLWLGLGVRVRIRVRVRVKVRVRVRVCPQKHGVSLASVVLSTAIVRVQ